jgi:lipoprotein-anchoring transpeptidase ErfK/SrfK
LDAPQNVIHSDGRRIPNAMIDKTRSHGCIRLTNWDVEELAALVKKGSAEFR